MFKHLFLKFETEIVVVNGHANDKLDGEEIMNEIITLIHCFSMKHYSKRRVKRSLATLGTLLRRVCPRSGPSNRGAKCEH